MNLTKGGKMFNWNRCEWPPWPGIVLILLVFAILFTGCLGLKPEVRPIGCENSVIYAKVSNPALVGKLIQLANLKALSKNSYKRSEAIKAVATIKALLEREPLSFSDFMEGVKPIAGKYFRDYGTELILIDTALIGLAVDIPVTDCDKGLIVSLCDKMLRQLGAKEGPLIQG